MAKQACRDSRWLMIGMLTQLWLGSSPAFGLERDVVISVFQGRCQEGDFSANLRKVRQIVEEAKSRQSDFVVFPETFLTGYESREVIERGARRLNDPELTQFVSESREHSMVILVGVARRTDDSIFNTVLIIHEGKLLGLYDKVMLTGGDRDSLGFKPGTSIPVFRALGVTFGVLICHDTSFPFPAMLASEQGAEILFTPHYNEIASQQMDDHRRWVRNCHVGLATQFKVVVARSNIVKSSRAGELGYGESFILSPQGTELSKAELFKEQLITARIEPAMFQGPTTWATNAETPSWLKMQIAEEYSVGRPFLSDADREYWLRSMIVDHRFMPQEIAEAAGMTSYEAARAVQEWRSEQPVPTPRREKLRMLPYPGGRHPRLGFREGAVAPQRETKVSVFAPWDDGSYVVVDVPEAIFSNLGLIYLAHTHVPTIWDEQGIKLARQEWVRHADGSLTSERRLPNGIQFGAKVIPSELVGAESGPSIRMTLWLENGTNAELSELRVQNCVMLGALKGFEQGTNDNKMFRSPYAIAFNERRDRWVITGWEETERCWGNERCPCLHADPRFPDCPPGQRVELSGWLSFFEGSDIDSEIARIDATDWRTVNDRK